MKLGKGFFLALLLTLPFSVVVAQKKRASAAKATPCMDVLKLFTAANVPAMAPEEEAAPLVASAEETPANLPGNGLAQHPMLYIGENNNRMSLITVAK